MKNNLLSIFFIVVSLVIIALSLISKDGIITTALINSIIVLALIILDMNIPRIAKLSKDNPKVKTMRQLNAMIITIILMISMSPILKLNKKIPIIGGERFLAIGIVIFIMIFGNLSPRIPFNRYMGLRLPWTIRDEETWKLAHRVLGYTSFPVGILMFIGAFFFNISIVMSIGIITWILIPGLYSLWFFYKKYKAH